MAKSIVKTQDAPAAIGPYSQGIVVKGELMFTAGQIALDPKSGQLVPGDIRVQTDRVLRNIQAILATRGATMADVVKTTVFLKDMNEFGSMNEVYGSFFSEYPPARSTVEVSRLPRDVNVEIEAIAVVGKD